MLRQAKIQHTIQPALDLVLSNKSLGEQAKVFFFFLNVGDQEAFILLFTFIHQETLNGAKGPRIESEIINL